MNLTKKKAAIRMKKIDRLQSMIEKAIADIKNNPS